MNKTLNQLLRGKRYQNSNVKISSVGGNGFWYCGSGKHAISEINKINALLLPQSKHNLKVLKHRLETIDKIYANRLKEKKGKVKNLKEYEKELNKQKAQELIELPLRIQSVQEDIDTHLIHRQVIEIVEGISPDEKPCWIIYIKGNEKGKYWTIKEYEHKVKIAKEDLE